MIILIVIDNFLTIITAIKLAKKMYLQMDAAPTTNPFIRDRH